MGGGVCVCVFNVFFLLSHFLCWDTIDIRRFFPFMCLTDIYCVCYISHNLAVLLLQGRLFISARIIGFHANLFGHRTKFFFLWEDIEDIQVVPPTLSSMGSPIIVMTLRPGRGMDARHGAKTQDEEGRLKFHFQSFVSFNVAHR